MEIQRAHTPERRADQEPDTIDDILALHRKDPQFMPEPDLMAACLGPFMVGVHTAAATGAFMLHATLKDPGLLQRARAEADEFFGNGDITAERLDEMDVIRRTWLEALRLYPTVPVAARRAINTFEFAGYTIPAGTDVLVATTLPHACAEYFPDPKRFDIDRYAPERREHMVPGVYAPFGMGSHRCIGSGFAETQLTLNLAAMLHEVDVTMHPPDFEMKVDNSNVPAPSKKFRISMTRRSRSG